MRVYHSISELVGHTPLVQLQRFAAARGLKANLLAKVEYFNPAGSVKDRIACAMLADAEQRGQNEAEHASFFDFTHGLVLPSQLSAAWQAHRERSVLTGVRRLEEGEHAPRGKHGRAAVRHKRQGNAGKRQNIDRTEHVQAGLTHQQGRCRAGCRDGYYLRRHQAGPARKYGRV